MKGMREYREKTEVLFKVPESVQQLIPVHRISEDGIFLLENKPEGADMLFDKAYLFLDTNFMTMDDMEKDTFLRQYCMLLNSLSVSFKILVINNNEDLDRIHQEICLKEKDGPFKEMTASFNRYIEECVVNGLSGLCKVRIFVVTCRKKDITQARDYFRSIEANLMMNFSRMESALIPLDASQRLTYIRSFYHMGEDSIKPISLKDLKGKRDFLDYIAPRHLRYYQDEYGQVDGKTLMINDRYVRILYLPTLPSGVSPDIMQKFLSDPFQLAVTIDIAAIPMEVVRRRLSELYMQNGRSIEKQQEIRNKAGAWSSDVSYDVRRQKAELEELLDLINDNNEKLFYMAVYVTISAATKKELENHVVAFTSRTIGDGYHFRPAIWEQIEAMNTAAPIGCRFCSIMYPLLSQPLSAFTPFIVHELYQKGGIVYGVNQISRNILIGDRKKLLNGNGFILGLSGSGKGMETKKEITEIYLSTEDDIIVIDPMNEYEGIADHFNGSFIDFSSASRHYINPLDIDTYEYMDSKATFLKDKTNLMLGIFSQIKENAMEPEDNSLIGRVVQEVYSGIGQKGFVVPTLRDFYKILKNQPEERAQSLALSMELFVTGAMNMFSKPTNVNTKNRMTVYGMADIDRSQSGMGIIIMLESIRSRIAGNAKKGRCTWVFIDEFHNLSHNPYSAAYLEKIWREVRKMGGLCTAITQNVADLLTTTAVESMLCNSEFLMLLNLKENERKLLENELGISPNLMQYISNADCGCGLLKFGNRVIPIDGRLPHDSEMYRLFNTNFHELSAIRKRKVKREGRDMEAWLRQGEKST